jgi:hypothetical protein
MNKRRIMLATTGVWLLTIIFWCVYYVHTRITSPDAVPGYETMWTFQCFCFSLTKLPIAVLILFIVLLGEYHFAKNKTPVKTNIS